MKQLIDMPADTPFQLRKFIDWLNRKHGLASETTYKGTLSPTDNKDEVWHEVTTTGDWITSAEEKHVRAHHSEQLDVFHGTAPNSFGEIMKTGGMKNGKIHAETSHTPWCCIGSSTIDKATQNSFGDKGCLVHLVVHGQRNAYNTSRKSAESRQVTPDQDWRKNFLEALPGRIITYQGSNYMKAEATEVKGFLIRHDKLDQLAGASYARKRGRR